MLIMVIRNQYESNEIIRQRWILITCSCSRLYGADNFEKMLRESAHEAGVTLKLVITNRPSFYGNGRTSYLKFYIFQII